MPEGHQSPYQDPERLSIDDSSTPVEVSSSRSSSVLKGVAFVSLSAAAVAAATSSRWAKGQYSAVDLKAQMWDDDKYGARPRYVEVSFKSALRASAKMLVANSRARTWLMQLLGLAVPFLLEIRAAMIRDLAFLPFLPTRLLTKSAGTLQLHRLRRRHILHSRRLLFV